MKSSVLIVDDEAGVRSALSGVLRDEGYDVDAVPTGEACLTTVGRRPVDVILLDVWLPGIDGLTTLSRLRERRVDAEVVIISGHGNVESAVRAIKMGAFDFVEKPLSLDKTILVVRNALRQRQLETENRALRAHVDRRLVMVGESHEIRQLREQIAMAAPTNGRVLIYGENGTGKELVARSVHALSRRRSGPFIEVNCAAIPEELIESELFGHVKGAFTGAVSDRRGRFEAADGGTIFLDEIADMSLKTQAKVLRVLQEQVVDPVGGTQSVKVDVRVLAATNKELPSEIRAGRFREDLFFRLNVIPIFVPPLRDRDEDIPLLAEHFMAELSREYGRRSKTLDASAVSALRRYAWPGNVRELRNVIERLMIMVTGDVISAPHLTFLAASTRVEQADAYEVDGQVLTLHDAHARRAAGQHFAHCRCAGSRAEQSLSQNARLRHRTGAPRRGFGRAGRRRRRRAPGRGRRLARTRESHLANVSPRRRRD
jgi:two-component system, NtrC family, nitrogen regulation response regulator NtrX